jgi:hypothetical protein
MKKSMSLFAIVLFVLFNLTVNAQQYGVKGCVEVGGTISYSSVTGVTNGTADSKSSSLLNFLPALGYFISDGISIGISPGINMIKMAGSEESITNLMLFAVGGYTFGTKGNVFPFAEGMIGYTSLAQDANQSAGTTKIDLSGISFGARGGVKILVGKSGLANFSVSYMMFTLNPEGADKRNGYNSLAVNVGFSVFLGK